jgi:monoamine oxidase
MSPITRLQHLFRRASAISAGYPDPGPPHPARREVLRGALAALGLAAVPSALGACAGGRQGPVAVIGAGIAGVHCARRLADAGVQVTLFEASDRIGGRMFTGRGLNPDGQTLELGGELIDSNHATLFALAEELGLTLRDRFTADATVLAPEVYEIGGTSVPLSTLVAQMAQVIPSLSRDFTAAETDDDAFARLDGQNLQTWLDENVPVSTVPELHVALRTAYRGEFGLECEQQSCLNLIYLIGFDDPEEFLIFGDSDERWATEGGNDQFPTLLAAPISDRVKLNHTLVSVTRGGEAKYECTFSTPDGEVVAAADHVVFAVPFTRLRDVALDVRLSDKKRTLIQTLGYGTNTKVMGSFRTPVWRRDHRATGNLTTDRDIQQTWETTLTQPGPSAILTNFLGGNQGVAAGEGEAEAWFTARLADLEALWPGTTAAYLPGTAVRMFWPGAPHARGSYTCYLPGQWETWGLEGEREGNLHFCGEHASLDFQGWMEGAAESGGLVAAEILDDMGLDWPDALTRAIRTALGRPQVAWRGDRRRLGSPLRRRRERLSAWRAALAGVKG